MEKNFITLEIENLRWADEAVEIDRAISDLQEAKAKGATHIEVERWVEYDCAVAEIDAVQKRFETDEEAKARIKHELSMQEASKKLEKKAIAT
jgi:hypothetical protein